MIQRGVKHHGQKADIEYEVVPVCARQSLLTVFRFNALNQFSRSHVPFRVPFQAIVAVFEKDRWVYRSRRVPNWLKPLPGRSARCPSPKNAKSRSGLQPIGALDHSGIGRPLPIRFDPSHALVGPAGLRTAPVAADHKAMERAPSAPTRSTEFADLRDLDLAWQEIHVLGTEDEGDRIGRTDGRRPGAATSELRGDTGAGGIEDGIDRDVKQRPQGVRIRHGRIGKLGMVLVQFCYSSGFVQRFEMDVRTAVRLESISIQDGA